MYFVDDILFAMLSVSFELSPSSTRKGQTEEIGSGKLILMCVAKFRILRMKFSRCSLLGKWERYSSQIAVQKQMTLRYNYYLIKLASVGVYDTHKLNTVLICPLCSSLNTQNNTNSATSCKKHTLRACAIETLTL
jgi:hypothetical protein